MSSRNWNFNDGQKLPVGTMYCIGRNYADHAKEMGGSVPASPIVFIKPPSAYSPAGEDVILPAFSANIHHEVELVVVLGSDASDITPAQAAGIIAGYGIGIDLTLRDMQSKAKERGEPWAVAKGFRQSAPISAIIPADSITPAHKFDIRLEVNGEVRQHCSTGDMEHSITNIIAYLSTIFDLRAGDCIFTGTPAGVRNLVKGDKVAAFLDGKEMLSFTCH